MRLQYHPSPIPVTDDTRVLAEYVQRELYAIAGAVTNNGGWDDETAHLSVGNPGGGSFGTPTGPTNVNGGPYQAYVFSAGDLIQIAFHIRHDIKLGSKIYPHVHWTTDGTQAGTVQWRIHYQIAKGHNQEAFPTATVLDIAAASTSGTAWQHMITEVTDAQAIDVPEVDSLVLMGIECEAITGLTTDDVYGLYVDLHYQKDHLGTNQRAPDFYK